GFEGTYGVFGPDGHVVALAKDEEGVARSVVVLSPAG
ncbi:MAG: tRNA pseudouridine(55) synthase TruB, partial [Umezawaea sp.]